MTPPAGQGGERIAEMMMKPFWRRQSEKVESLQPLRRPIAPWRTDGGCRQEAAWAWGRYDRPTKLSAAAEAVNEVKASRATPKGSEGTYRWGGLCTHVTRHRIVERIVSHLEGSRRKQVKRHQSLCTIHGKHSPMLLKKRPRMLPAVTTNP